MIELTLHEHWVLNCLVRNRAHFFYDSIDYKNAPDINTLQDFYLEHFQGLLGQPVKVAKADSADVIENRSNTIIDKLLGNDANSYKTSKHRKAHYQVIDVY